MVFCVVRVVHNFHFRLNKKKIRHAVIKTDVFDRINTLSHPPSSKTLRNCTHSVQVNCFVLKKEQHLVTNAAVVGAGVSVAQKKDRKDNNTADCRKRGGERIFT